MTLEPTPKHKRNRTWILLAFIAILGATQGIRWLMMNFEEEQVGIITAEKGMVEHRSRGQNYWQQITRGNGEVLRTGDELTTADQSSARVKLNNGVELELLPKTHVRVDRTARQETDLPLQEQETRVMVELLKGAVRANINPNQPLDIGAFRKGFHIAPDPNGGAMSVLVYANANAQMINFVEEKGTEFKIIQNFSIPDETDDPADSLMLLPTLVYSKSGKGSTRLGKGDVVQEIPLLLRWRAPKDATEFEVTVFRTDGTVFLKKRVNKPEMAFELKTLKKKQLRYQVKAFRPKKRALQSERAQIEVYLAPPFLRLPKSGEEFHLGESVVLTWEITLLTQSYDLQVSEGPEFKIKKINRKILENVDTLYLKEKGKFYWRVRANVSGKKSAWSATRHFSIK